MFDLLCRRRILENLRYPVVDKIFFCSVQAVVLLGNLPNGWRYLRVGGRGQNSESRILFGRGKCPKMAQNPTRQVHALLGGVLWIINYFLFTCNYI